MLRGLVAHTESGECRAGALGWDMVLQELSPFPSLEQAPLLWSMRQPDSTSLTALFNTGCYGPSSSWLCLWFYAFSDCESRSTCPGNWETMPADGGPGASCWPGGSSVGHTKGNVRVLANSKHLSRGTTIWTWGVGRGWAVTRPQRIKQGKSEGSGRLDLTLERNSSTVDDGP